MAMYGQGKTRGKTAMLGIAAAMNQACAAIEPTKEVLPDYLLIYLKSQYEAIRGLSNAGSQENLSGEIVKGIEVVVPPIAEQLRIATIVGDAEREVAAYERLISKKLAVKHGLMEQLLTGRIRLSGFTEPWQIVTLGESGVITGGGVDKVSKPTETPVKLLNYMDVYRAEFVDMRSISQVVTASASEIAKCSIKAGDVFFTPTSETPDDIARSAVACAELPGAVYSYHLVRWRPKAGWDPLYLGYAFRTRDFRSQASTQAAGSGTRYVVSMPAFRSLTVPQPPVDEQRAIGRVLRDTSAELAALNERLSKARALKTGILQQLLTGRAHLTEGTVR